MIQSVLRALGLALLFCGASPAGAEPLEEVRARELLMRLLSLDETRRATARAGIVRSGDKSVLPALVDALFFAAAESRHDVVRCLEELSGERLGMESTIATGSNGSELTRTSDPLPGIATGKRRSFPGSIPRSLASSIRFSR